MRVIGVDVGIKTNGICVADVRNLDVDLILEKEITPCPKDALHEKLGYIYHHVEGLVMEFAPEALIFEKLYSHHKHPTTLGVLAQVQGALNVLAYMRGLSIYEYPITRIRKAFLGRGNVNSQQVRKMAEHMAQRPFRSVHTADAYSLVVAFAHDQKLLRLKKTNL